jgi:hypothetical protein
MPEDELILPISAKKLTLVLLVAEGRRQINSQGSI